MDLQFCHKMNHLKLVNCLNYILQVKYPYKHYNKQKHPDFPCSSIFPSQKAAKSRKDKQTDI